MSRLNSRENFTASSRQRFLPLLLIHFFELSASEATLLHRLIPMQNTQLFRDSNSCFFSVASNHNHVDTCGSARLNTVFYFVAGWVANANVADEGAARLKLHILGGVT